MKILQEIQNRSKSKRKSLAILVDPDKISDLATLHQLKTIAKECCVDFFFVGGSLLTYNNFDQIVKELKFNSDIPVVIFPGNNMQISNEADSLLLLSLVSGRNPEYLIGQHVNAAPLLKRSALEVISTGYLVINSDADTAVSYMSNTMPIPPEKYAIATSTALAAEMIGMSMIYLDAGSGARQPISSRMIRKIREQISLPLIVGGGINNAQKANSALEAGADVLVIGNAVEKNPNLIIEVSDKIYDFNNSLDVH